MNFINLLSESFALEQKLQATLSVLIIIINFLA